MVDDVLASSYYITVFPCMNVAFFKVNITVVCAVSIKADNLLPFIIISY